MTAGELLELFTSPKDVKEEPDIPEKSQETSDVRKLEAIENTTENENEEPIEPDEQIKMLGAARVTTVSEAVESVEEAASDKTCDEFEIKDKNKQHTESLRDVSVQEVQTVTNNLLIESSAMEELEEVQGTLEPATPADVFRCKSCPEIFPTHRQLIKHMAQEHPEDLTMFKCDDCDKIYFTEYDLKDHRAYCHSDDKVHTCEECGKR